MARCPCGSNDIVSGVRLGSGLEVCGDCGNWRRQTFSDIHGHIKHPWHTPKRRKPLKDKHA